MFRAPLHIHLEHNVQTGRVFKTLGTVLCKLMTKNVQEHSKKKKKVEVEAGTVQPLRVRLADLCSVFQVLVTILEDGSDERQQKESRIKSHMLSCIPACSKGHT